MEFRGVLRFVQIDAFIPVGVAHEEFPACLADMPVTLPYWQVISVWVTESYFTGQQPQTRK